MISVTPLFSGSSGNCTYVECNGTEILVDAGVSCLSVARALTSIGSDIQNISAIFVTHEHCDHIKGLEVISKKYDIPVFINEKSAYYIRSSCNSPCLENCIHIRNAGESVTLGSLCLDIYKTPHDSCGSVCYRMSDTDGDSFGLATDIGYVTKAIASALIGCDKVLIESNHDIKMLMDGPYPYSLKQRILSDSGHLSNESCARFLPYLVEGGAEKIWLGHLSRENNTPEVALKTSLDSLANAGANAGERASANFKGCEVAVAPIGII